MSDVTVQVQIERTKRREIIRAVLTEYIPASLRDEPAEKMTVTDNEIKDFVLSLSSTELRRISESKLGKSFRKNANDALARLAALTARPRRGSNQAPGVLLKFEPNEVIKSYQPEKPKK